LHRLRGSSDNETGDQAILDEFDTAYYVFGYAADTGALKVLLTAT